MADACFESLCIRATLDAFWSRSKKTVADHIREVRFMARYGQALAFNTMPPLGPFRLGTHNGMAQAILLELRLLEKGRAKLDPQGRSTVMYGTARMIRSTSTVLWENSPASGSDIVMSSGQVRGRFVATMCPSEGRWYQHFSAGCAARMGDIVTQDRAYTIEIVLAVIQMYEDNFQQEGFNMNISTFEAAMFFMISCFGGFRGFETVWTDLAALRYDVQFCEETDDFTAVAWPVTGRFKMRRVCGDITTYPLPASQALGFRYLTGRNVSLGGSRLPTAKMGGHSGVLMGPIGLKLWTTLMIFSPSSSGSRTTQT